MKTKMLLAICIMLSCMACSKLEYSCSPTTNEWVLQNKEQYANVPRAQLATFDPDKQLGLFRSFVPEQKVRIYQEKYNYLMGLDSLSIPEKAHLTKLYRIVSPDIYASDAAKQKFNEFADAWAEEAKQLLGWTEKEIFLYTHTWLTLEEVNDRIGQRVARYEYNDNTGDETDIKDCTCHYSISCIFSISGLTCKTGGCYKVDGCGISGTSNCTGLCD